MTKAEKAVEVREMALNFHNNYSIEKIFLKRISEQEKKRYDRKKRNTEKIVGLFVVIFVTTIIIRASNDYINGMMSFAIYDFLPIVAFVLILIPYYFFWNYIKKFDNMVYFKYYAKKYKSKKFDENVAYEIQKDKFKELINYSNVEIGNYGEKLYLILTSHFNKVQFLMGKKDWSDYVIAVMATILVSGLIFCVPEHIACIEMGIEYTEREFAILSLSFLILIYIPCAIIAIFLFFVKKKRFLTRKTGFVSIQILEELMLEEADTNKKQTM